MAQNDRYDRTTAIPTARQLEYQQLEYGLFVHYGIATYYPDRRDFDDTKMQPSAFQPTDLDPEQWINSAEQAGMKYAVFTAKHHDGWCNWPSKYTDFCISNSPWKEGQGDLVREYVEACRRHNFWIGLYYSPYDEQCTEYADDKAYDDYFINQLSELLANYGKIDILWLDGCRPASAMAHEYDWPRIFDAVFALQPDILLFNTDAQKIRWVGNERGIAPSPCWNTEPGADGGLVWLPAECDCKIRDHWFYRPGLNDLKGVEELLGMYDYSIGRGTNLLLNVGPDASGLLPSEDVQRLMELKTAVDARRSKPLGNLTDGASSTECWNWKSSMWPAPLVNMVELQEELSSGEHITGWRVELLVDNQWILVGQGESLGNKAICRFPPFRCSELRVLLQQTPGGQPLRGATVYGV